MLVPMSEIVVVWIIATLLAPFLIGFALGHAGFAAAAFAALGITTLLLSFASGQEQVMQGMAVSFLLSSVPAYFGGWLRNARRRPGGTS
jgi:hypothetical protein